MSKTETVKVVIELPRRLKTALDWYVRLTKYWVSNDLAEDSLNKLLTYIIEGFLEEEADSPSLPVDWIKQTLKTDYNLTLISE